MSNISATLVKALRDETNAGMMDCKRALVSANGDKNKAIQILRERGIGIAAKKALRKAADGIIVSTVIENGKSGSLVEVNCETDFVAKNDRFKNFVQALAEKACHTDENLAQATREEVTALIAEVGENIIVRRNTRFILKNNGIILSYIHHNNTLGVLAEIGCEKEETVTNDAFKQLAKDICLHIAALHPSYLDSKDVPSDVIASERAIYAKQFQGKPPNIVEKIVDGKMKKFYAEVCLVNQAFVKDQDTTIQNLLKTKGNELGDTIQIRRFVRYEVGEGN